MNRFFRYFRTRSIRLILVASCAAILLTLVLSNILATFMSFKNTVWEAVNVQTWELSTQIVYNYENYISSIIKTSNTIQMDIDQYNLLTPEGALIFSSYLGQIIHQKGDIIKIAVYTVDNGVCLASSRAGDIGEPSDDEDDTWFFEAVADPTVHVFSVPYSEDETGRYKMNISKQIKTQRGNTLAVLKIELSFQNIIELIRKTHLGETGHVTIIDPDYNVVYCSLEYGDHAAECEVIADIILGSQNVFLNGHHMTVNVDTLSNTKWRICVFINVEKINAIQSVFMRIVVLISFLVSASGVLLFLFVTRMITDPMKQLELAMLKVEKADYFQMEKVNLEASKEVTAMTRQFNKMMVKISELMERVIQEQRVRRTCELKVLQNQINPHFLYNTLESILWLVEKKNTDKASQMVVALSRLFRLSISTDREIIPLKNEIEHVRSYLLIQSVRYADDFNYEFEVDEDLLGFMTMKLILQPLVENCIYHGLKNKIDKGIIRVSARGEDSYLVLSVSDNGYGMKQEAIDRLYASFACGAVGESVGLKNIYQRIMIYYGGKAELHIESELDKGTVVTIKEPIDRS